MRNSLILITMTHFFDSFKKDYKEFPLWLEKKAREGESAYVLYDDKHKIEGFMYLKRK